MTPKKGGSTTTISDKASYAAYLRSETWQATKRRKLSSVDWCCENCGAEWGMTALDVHHLTYERLGREKDEDLRVLCRACHGDEHRQMGPFGGAP